MRRSITGPWIVPLLAVALLSAPGPVHAAPASPLEVVMPDHKNRQFMLMWITHGAGLIDREGVAIELVIAPHHRQAARALETRPEACAVLPPPLYFGLLARRAPVKLVANLLARDPANLVLRADRAAAAGVAPGPGEHRAPPVGLAERFANLGDLRIGVAHGPPPRLGRMLAAAGVAPERIQQEIIGGSGQNAALASGRVDALFAHTPYLERALIRGDGVLWVHTSGGEVASLTDLLVHALVCQRRALTNRRDQIRGLVRALDAGRDLIQRDPDAAARALATALGEPMSPEHALIVKLYQPAMPAELTPRVEDLIASIRLFPDLGARLAEDPDGLRAFVERDLAAPPQPARYGRSSPPDGWWIVMRVCAGLLGLVLVAAVALQRIRRRS